MPKTKNHPRWSEEEFLGFLLIYAAYADMEFSVKERDIIKNNLSENDLQELEKEFQEMNDIEILQTIESYREKYFSSDAEKEQLFSILSSFFTIDGDYNVMEKNLMRMLHKIL